MEQHSKLQQELVNESSPQTYLHLQHQPNEILRNPTFNKGTAFVSNERDAFRLRGLLPAQVQTLEQQARSSLYHLRSFATPIQKYLYLASLRQRNETLFFRVLMDNLEETMPIVYTPTVGEVCQLFDKNWRVAEGMYFTKEDKGNMRAIVDNWIHPKVDIIVVTDGSRILGLGDLGANGMGIPIGKLSLYVAAAGFHPARTLPITLDLGTNNKQYLDDPHYLGMKHLRLKDDEYNSLVDEFMAAVTNKWPNVLVQFEDFSNEHAFGLLTRYRHKYFCFNDDIQGTGAVVTAGFINAVRLSSSTLGNQKILFFGAGSAGVGVADAIVDAMVSESQGKLTKEEAHKKFWLIDSKGLVTANRGDKLDHHKVPYARTDNGDKQCKTIEDCIDYIHPTALVGLAGVSGGEFTPTVISKMSSYNKKPIIFALSNPTNKSECTAESAYTHSQGTAIFASGSPFDPVEIPSLGKKLYPSQGNNMYVFPGIGFGAVVGECKEVTDGMLLVTAKALADSVTQEELDSGRLYPSLKRIRDVSSEIAVRIIQQAVKEGVGKIGNKTEAELRKLVNDAQYKAEYASFVSKV